MDWHDGVYFQMLNADLDDMLSHCACTHLQEGQGLDFFKQGRAVV